MGGYGSGRTSYSFATKCEDLLSIDLALLRRRKGLTPGSRSTFTWSRGGQKTGSVAVASESDGVRLVYYARQPDGSSRPINEKIPFAYTPTRFGGRRQWFCCPSCGQNCRILYGGRLFRCRTCYRLKYSSQYEPAFQRALDRADKLRNRVSGRESAFECSEFPEKPKRMRWQTYERLLHRYEELQGSWVSGIAEKFGMRER